MIEINKKKKKKKIWNKIFEKKNEKRKKNKKIENKILKKKLKYKKNSRKIKKTKWKFWKTKIIIVIKERKNFEK